MLPEPPDHRARTPGHSPRPHTPFHRAPRGHPAEDPLEPDEEYPVPESAPGAEEPDPPEELKPEPPVV